MRRAAFFALLFAVTSVGALAGIITRVGELAIARRTPTATLLSDGRVLVAGGDSVERRLEILDPQTGRSTLIDAESELPLLGHAAARLQDGSVLLTGGGYLTDGRPAFGNYGSTASQAYDRATNTLIARGRMNVSRLDHTATLLADGRVLIAGGETVNVGGFHLWRTVYDSAEIFDPVTNAFVVTGTMHEERYDHTATLLADGRVLIAGGRQPSGVTDSLEIFDPGTATFAEAGRMIAPRADHAAALLADGRVIIAGGDRRIEIFDPIAKQSTLVADIELKTNPTVTLLRNGNVLIAGGNEDAIVFDPVSETIVETIVLPEPISAHAAVTVSDGSVLLIGGSWDFTRKRQIARYRLGDRTKRRAVGR